MRIKRLQHHKVAATNIILNEMTSDDNIKSYNVAIHTPSKNNIVIDCYSIDSAKAIITTLTGNDVTCID